MATTVKTVKASISVCELESLASKYITKNRNESKIMLSGVKWNPFDERHGRHGGLIDLEFVLVDGKDVIIENPDKIIKYLPLT